MKVIIRELFSPFDALQLDTLKHRPIIDISPQRKDVEMKRILQVKKANAFKLAVKRYGIWAAARQARNLGIDFIDAYVGFFNRMPTKGI